MSDGWRGGDEGEYPEVIGPPLPPRNGEGWCLSAPRCQRWISGGIGINQEGSPMRTRGAYLSTPSAREMTAMTRVHVWPIKIIGHTWTTGDVIHIFWETVNVTWNSAAFCTWLPGGMMWWLFSVGERMLETPSHTDVSKSDHQTTALQSLYIQELT